MAEGMNNLLGGLMTGFVGSKNKAREMGMMEEYRKAATEHVKTQAKLEEQKINLAAMKLAGLPPDIQNVLNRIGNEGGQPAPQPVQTAPVQPFAQYNPQPAPQAAAPQPLENTIAAGQMPLGGGLVSMSPEGQKSTRYNNPLNLEYRPWQDKYGARPGEDGRFGAYQTPEAGLAAATERIQQLAAGGATVASAIETWAPTKENPNTPQRIMATAKALGVSPDTPLANVPLYPFVATQVKYESPTQVNPAFYGEAGNMPIGQTIGQGLGSPQQAMQPRAMPAPSFPKKTGIGSLPLGDRLALDVFFKERYDLQTGFAKEGGRRYSLQGDPLKGYVVFDQFEGNIVNQLPPTTQSYEPYNYKEPYTGREYFGYRPDKYYAPAGQAPGGGLGSPQGAIPPSTGRGNLVTPGPGETRREVSAETTDKTTAIDKLVERLNTLETLATDDKTNVFGLMNSLRYKAAESPLGGVLPSKDPTLIKFNKLLADTRNVKLQDTGGKNLTATEVYYAMDALPRIWNREDFLTAVDTIRSAALADRNEITQKYNVPSAGWARPVEPPSDLTPKNTRGMRTTPLSPSNALPPGAKPTNRTSGGKPVYQLPDGTLVVQ